jgi:hypothetical protein
MKSILALVTLAVLSASGPCCFTTHLLAQPLTGNQAPSLSQEQSQAKQSDDAAFAQDVALKTQQIVLINDSFFNKMADSNSAASDDACKGHHPNPRGCRGAISDAQARANYCYCP